MSISHTQARYALPGAIAMLACTALLALCAGRYPVSLADVVRTVAVTAHLHAEPAHYALLHAVIVDARLPRLLAAALVGAALSTAGATYQAVFRNPLVSPGLLGVLSGSAFGAALGIVLGAHGAWVQVSAFVAGMMSVAVGLAVARMLGGGGVLMLVLGGLVSNALFSSLLSLIKYVADPMNQLPAIVYWLLGSLAQTGWTDLARLAVPLIVGIAVLCVSSRILDALTLGDDEARSLGVPVSAIRVIVIGVATLISALTVSLAGVIGWIGLLVPHIARAWVGASNRRVVPLSALLGATGLLLADTCARSVSTDEIPLGIITELFGALAFVVVLRRLRQGGLE
ncbi:iron ABC transporter permease [Paraburkholderia sp.]|uniref:FecCD family ABC transporter permease n=1 Tax=Paraburkholderia sp. TaxID=1926495 RepID=UPI00239D6BE4|nr:iron ABC transporter permease [Paraburkholderia sp.]MDE1180567.1 iron ABC transporter permease [Paraburkholderia sp.]